MKRPAFLLLVGIALLTYAGASWAQQVYAQARGPDWSLIATGAVGLVTMLTGAYAKGMERRVTKTERDIEALRSQMFTSYHDKADVERIVQQGIAVLRAELSGVTRSVDAVHDRLDRMNAPHGGGVR